MVRELAVVDSHMQDEIEAQVRGFDSFVSQSYCSQRNAVEPDWQRRCQAVGKYERVVMFHGTYFGVSEVGRRKKCKDLDCIAAE